MKLTESMLRKIIKEQIDDFLSSDPSMGGDTSSDRPPAPLRFSQRLEACAQTGKPITLKVDLVVSQKNASSDYPTQYTLDGDKRTSYRTENTLPTRGESFKVLKYIGGETYKFYTDAKVVGPRSRELSQSSDNHVVMIQNDKFGKFTVALMPNEVQFGR